MPMHVLQLGPFPPPEGGVTRNMLAIRKLLIDSGDRCSMIATTQKGRAVDEPDVYHPPSAAHLLARIRTINFDVLHLHLGGAITPRVLGLALACSRLGRGRCVLTMHSGAYSQSAPAIGSGQATLAGLVFRRFSRLIAVSDELANVFRRFGVSDDRIHVIAPHAVSAPDPAVEIPSELRSFFDGHSPTFLAVGGLEPDYDPMLQLAAMKDVLRTQPRAGLMIVGEGTMREEVSNAIDAAGLTGNVQLAGNVDHAVTLHLIEKADVLLRTTMFDGNAISIQEALFLGTPVIATNTGSRPEGVEVIPIGDRDALAKRLIEIGGRGRAAPNKGLAGDENIEAVIRLYRELAHGRTVNSS
jgi:glycosyltransferase involved in cell wall biosynthesis